MKIKIRLTAEMDEHLYRTIRDLVKTYEGLGLLKVLDFETLK